MCEFSFKLKGQLILLFSLFLLLFNGTTVLFSTIQRSYYTISTNFYLYQQYFQQKVVSFSKIIGSQIVLMLPSQNTHLSPLPLSSFTSIYPFSLSLMLEPLH